MFCKHCGKSIAEGSIFCEFCGGKVSDTKEVSKTRETKEDRTKITIWDKFTEIYDSKDYQREEYLALTSDETWEAIGKLPTNSCEDYLKEHKQELNKQPYKAIEAIEKAFKGSILVGYWAWLAENLIKNGNIKKPHGLELQQLIKEWADVVQKKQQKFLAKIPDELALPFMNMLNHRMSLLFESAPSLKEVPNELIKSLKSSLLLQMVWGYMLGIAENKYRIL